MPGRGVSRGRALVVYADAAVASVPAPFRHSDFRRYDACGGTRLD
ncbi:hypothetical protein BPORC_1737 [Bifidobacterium porcinum]|nr:hypothetical protein BPORC_1737 [Bifidobacterium porcinum]